MICNHFGRYSINNLLDLNTEKLKKLKILNILRTWCVLPNEFIFSLFLVFSFIAKMPVRLNRHFCFWINI